MNGIQRETDQIFDGPWLIPRSALEDLDARMAVIWSRFQRVRADRIAVRLRDQLDDYGEKLLKDRPELLEETERRLEAQSGLEKELQLTLREQRHVRFDAIQSALDEPVLIQERPHELTYTLQCDDLSARVRFDKSSLPSIGRVSVSTSPQSDPIAQEAFAQLQHWADKHQAPFWRRVWAIVAPWSFFVVLTVVLMSTLILGVATSSERAEMYGPTVEQILDNGIQQDEIPIALEFLLRSDFGIALGEESANEFPTWYLVGVPMALVIAVLISIRPKLVIGLGKGEAMIRRWHVWIKTIAVTLPGLVFTTVLWPYILQFFRSI